MAVNANNINYQTNLPSSSNHDEYLARGDWNSSQKNQLFGTVARFMSSGGANTITPGLFGISVPLTGTNASITDTQIVNDHVVNALKIGYNRSNLFRTQQGTGAKNYAAFYGLNNLNPLLAQSTPPAISVSNYTSLGDPYSPQGAIQNRYQFADQVTWTRGNHTVTLGGEFIRVQFNGSWVVTNNGNYGFDGSATSQYVAGKRSSANQGNALADLELGFPVNGSGLTGTLRGLVPRVRCLRIRPGRLARFPAPHVELWPALRLRQSPDRQERTWRTLRARSQCEQNRCMEREL